MNSPQFSPGTIVTARGHEWVVLPKSTTETLHLRTLGGNDDNATILAPALEREPIKQATFPYPELAHSGIQSAGLLLRDALMLKLRSGAGPFRSFGNIAVEPRAYQLVPLMMALKLETIRLLIADDVGVGKTIEAGLIAREMLDRGEIDQLTVLCPPHLCEQWHEELKNRFHIDAAIVKSTTAKRLERGLPAGSSIFTEYPYTIISLDYIKNKNRRDAFAEQCPNFVIVDEAHTCSRKAQGRQQRYELLKELSEKEERHLVLLTATPHSGDENAFYNLLSLLKPQFEKLVNIQQATHPLRQDLANHFVQRRRQDIKEWQEGKLFPDRLTAEVTYKLSGQWESIFTDVMDYARELVEREEEGSIRARMNWWAALALLRCISSSPQAAIRAFNTRITKATDASKDSIKAQQEALDEQQSPSIFDGNNDDLSFDDVEPGAAIEQDINRLQQLMKRAQELKSSGDPKLKALVRELKPVLQEGYNPVIFCRYIATAEYLAEELARKFKDREVVYVTGNYTSTEREGIIETLKENEKQPLLVATDCLSEGINLQDQFNAIIHYDLSWNPTRHEQREGRVDRFGQKAKTVKALMLYGDDNPIDGAVLQVILRKAENIRKALGVSVPMPEDDNRITQAILKTVLLHKDPANMSTRQGALALDFGDQDDIAELEASWESAKEKAKKHRTLFAQNRLKPEEVMPEWEKAFAVLGTNEDVERFVSNACERLGASLHQLNNKAYQAPLDHLPSALKDHLLAEGILKLTKQTYKIAFTYPSPPSVEFIHRTHPLVSHLANYLAEIAMSGEDTKLIARAGAILTKDVATKTTVYILRIRYRLVIKRQDTSRDLIAEEAIAVAISGNEREAQVLPKEQALELMQSKVSKNMTIERKDRELSPIIEDLPEQQILFERIAIKRAELLLEDHRRTRSAADAKGSYKVEPQLPIDVMGVYILVPDLELF